MEIGIAWCCSSTSKSNNNIFPLVPHRCVISSPNKSKRKSTNMSVAAVARFSVPKRCQKCGGKGAIDCPGCKGTGKNKKNGNIFERWKCFECQGFGLKSCPDCGNARGLTPEQRGER